MKSLKQSKQNAVVKGLEKIGIEYLAYLPCSTSCAIWEHFHKKSNVKVVMLNREEEGIGIMAGLEACHKKAVLLIQDSGLGNSLNAFVSLAGVYRIPMVVLVTRRGGFNEINQANAEFGEITPEVIGAIRAMGFILDYKVPLDEWEQVVVRTYQYAHLVQKPIILLLNLKD